MAYAAKRDLLKAGSFAGLPAYLTKVTGVNNGGTVTISGDWIGLPSLKPYKYKRVFDTYEIEEQTGSKNPVKTLIGFDVKTIFNQRDAATYELDASYVGAECILLLAGHHFRRMTAPINRTWLAVFGIYIQHEDEIDVKNGEVPFYFSGQSNAQAIVLGAAVGAIAYPTDAGITAPIGKPPATGGDITIAASGIYKFTDIADT